MTMIYLDLSTELDGILVGRTGFFTNINPKQVVIVAKFTVDICRPTFAPFTCYAVDSFRACSMIPVKALSLNMLTIAMEHRIKQTGEMLVGPSKGAVLKGILELVENNLSE